MFSLTYHHYTYMYTIEIQYALPFVEHTDPLSEELLQD